MIILKRLGEIRRRAMAFKRLIFRWLINIILIADLRGSCEMSRSFEESIIFASLRVFLI